MGCRPGTHGDDHTRIQVRRHRSDARARHGRKTRASLSDRLCSPASRWSAGPRRPRGGSDGRPFVSHSSCSAWPSTCSNHHALDSWGLPLSPGCAPAEACGGQPLPSGCTVNLTPGSEVRYLCGL
jgi:hypothetical protein